MPQVSPINWMVLSITIMTTLKINILSNTLWSNMNSNYDTYKNKKKWLW